MCIRDRTYEVGRINSYVLVPVGARVVVAMVTRVVLAEEAEIRTDRTMVVLPSARRLMKATMVGTIDDKHFTQGVNVFPVLDSPVLLVGRRELQAICGHSDRAGPGYCIPVSYTHLSWVVRADVSRSPPQERQPSGSSRAPEGSCPQRCV